MDKTHALARECLHNPIDYADYNTTFYHARVGDVFVHYLHLLDIATIIICLAVELKCISSTCTIIQDGIVPSKSDLIRFGRHPSLSYRP